ncbi:phage portal protein [Streptomyces jumonjinensis]|uniref:phage portal protein n=1 Tax=Streptomyces jumonjinensis TaxID=1945 RepID=UPI0037965B31
MGSNSTLFAIIERITTAIAETEWKLYRSAKSGLDEDRVEVTSHAALDLWRHPNKFMTSADFTSATQQHDELVGEQWWVVSYRPGIKLPLEIWPVRPDRMEPVPSKDDFLVGYVYTGPSGEKIPLGTDEVIFIRRPSPLDPYRGMGPVQTLLIDLDASRASAEWNATFFRNSAEPGGVLEVDKRLDDDEFEELRARWNEQHKGVSNANRVAILEGGLKWVDRKFTMRDMQFAELREVSREIIREAFGFPKPMLGATDDVNRANAEAAAYVFARWLIRPRLERIRQALNSRLLPLYGATARGLEFDFTNPVPDDREADAAELTARAGAVKLLVEAGAYGPEALAAVGLPEIPFGQPGADPDKELLIDLVKAAPAALADRILPLLGYNLPPPPAPAGPPPAVPEPGTPSEEPEPEPDAELGARAALPDVAAAQRWVVQAVIDDNTCTPCRDNDGRTYRSRADAYRDYPGGEGYVNCVGAEYGNECRCTVMKRGRKGSGE